MVDRIRRQLDAAGVLRGRRRVQLQPHRRLRVPRRDGVRGPVQGGELGRHPPHGGGVQGHRRRMAARPVRATAHTEPRALKHCLELGLTLEGVEPLALTWCVRCVQEIEKVFLFSFVLTCVFLYCYYYI